LRRLEDSIVALWQLNAVIGNSDYLQQLGVKLYFGDSFAIGFLYQVFLRFPLGVVLFVLSLFDLLHQVTLAVTVHPGPVTVLTKFRGNVAFIQLETGKNKKPREATAYDNNDEQYGCDFVLHERWCKGKRNYLFCKGYAHQMRRVAPWTCIVFIFIGLYIILSTLGFSIYNPDPNQIMIKYFFALAFLCVFTANAQTHSEAASGMFQISGTHAAVYPQNHYTGLGDIKWKFKTMGKVFSSPAVHKGIAYIGSGDHNLYALDAKTGRSLWKFTTGGAVHSSPTVYKNVVYFGSYDGFYYALNATTGKSIWKFKTGGEKKVGTKGLWTMSPQDQYMEDQYDFFLSSPVLDLNDKNLTLYFGSSDGNLYALNASTGKKKWAFKTNGIIRTSPALYKGKVYIGSWDTFLYALDAHTGKLQWKFETGKQPVYHVLEGIQSSPACADSMLYFGSRDGFFYALNAGTGKQIWKYAADNSWVLTTPIIKDGLVYIGTSDTFLLLAFDAKTGKEKLRYKTNGYIYSSPAIAGSMAYFGDFSGSLCAVDLNSGKLANAFTTAGRNENAPKVLTPEGNIDFGYLAKGKDLTLYATSVEVMDKLYTLGPIVSSPAVNGGVVYFGSADGYLYAVNLK